MRDVALPAPVRRRVRLSARRKQADAARATAGIRLSANSAPRKLAPAIDALSWWGLRHAWRPPRPGERLHVEHLLRALTQAIERTGDDHGPARWHVRIDRVGDYLIRSDGEHWSLVWLHDPDQPAPPHERSADVFVAADETSFAQFVINPSAARAAKLNIDIRGEAEARGRFERLLGVFTRSIPT